MNFDPIKRGVRRGVRTRETGSAPDIGRVERVHRVFRHESRRQGKGDARRIRSQRTRRLMTFWWSVGIGVLAFGLLLTAFGFWLKAVYNRENPRTARQQPTAALKPQANKITPPSKAEALALVERILQISRPDEAERWVRCGEATSEQVAAYFTKLRADEPAAPALAWLSSLDHNHLQMEGVEVSYRNEPPRKDHLALLFPDEDGSWKMDFAAFARPMDPSWQAVLAGAPNPDTEPPWGVARVFFGREQQPYYNGIYLNEDKWVAYGLASPDLAQRTLSGYCLRGSAQHRALERILASADGTPYSRAILKIRRPEGAEPKQVEIGCVLAEDWMLGGQPFEEEDSTETPVPP